MKCRLGLLLIILSSGVSHAQETNVALHKPVSATSAAAGFPASNMVDGKINRLSKWEAGTGRAPHIVEIDLQKYYSIRGIKVHSGITDAEKKPDELSQAAGFWSVKNFKLQYWDDANWSDFPNSEVHENRETTASFRYTAAVTTYRVRLVCDDGEPINIMELEVLGTETPNMPEPPAVAASVQSRHMSTRARSATITVEKKIIGKSMKYVGYNQGYYFPGSNTSGWVEYAGVNGFRVWATMNAFVPESAVELDTNLASVETFDKKKAELRSSPENNLYLKWPQLLPLYDRPDSSSTNAMVYSYALSELKRLGVDVILQMGSTDFNETWTNKWKQWQRYYALAYYSARQGNVCMFAMQNEPNHRNSGPMKLDQWISAAQIVSDAIHCAVEDVNKNYGKSLVPKFVGPVTAGNNPEWWAAVAKSIRTDYHNKIVDKDWLEIFSTHSYNSPAAGYTSRVENIRKIIMDNHPNGKSLPIVYTEIGRWMNAYLIDKEETMDSPSLFTEWAGIYAANMKNGGYGMFAFKFANTASSTYPLGIKSGHHFVWHGKRIVEDAYNNLAAGRKALTSSGATLLVTDGRKDDASAWLSDTAKEKWIEINLEGEKALGAAVIYTGSDGGKYTAPDRVKSFRLQSWTGGDWKDIPGTAEKGNKYAQVFQFFDEPVRTGKVRFISTDPGRLKVREIKLFAAGDELKSAPNFDVSGIQRTAEVVRLFATGFKNERPLLQTSSSADDNGMDAMTCFDSTDGNYYMWLVQRGPFDYHLKINLASLGIPSSAIATVQTVSGASYGEVTHVIKQNKAGVMDFTLAAQSVVLLTVPLHAVSATTVVAAADATVQPGKTASVVRASQKQLFVALNAAMPLNNKVAYIHFHLPDQLNNPQRVLLKLNGFTNKTEGAFRLHVYAIPGRLIKQPDLDWKHAPLLDEKEAWLHGVGSKAFVAGELAFTGKAADHYLDITALIKRHPAQDYTFVAIRETRELGDDEDKSNQVILSSAEAASAVRPGLLIWQSQNDKVKR